MQLYFVEMSSLFPQSKTQKKKVRNKKFLALKNFNNNSYISLALLQKTCYMKIKKLIIALLAISNLCVAQQYDGLKIERSKERI